MARRLVRGFTTAGVGVLTTLAFLALATPAVAQQGVTTGAINGQVLDSSGAPLAGATVTIRNVDTGTSRELQTNVTGRYNAGFLQTGSYNVAAEFPPNPVAERGPIRISLGETQVVDLVVQPVEVAAIGVVIDPENQVDVTEGGFIERIDQDRIEKLPALGRDFVDFINLSGLVSPAVGTTTGGQFSLRILRGEPWGFSSSVHVLARVDQGVPDHHQWVRCRVGQFQWWRDQRRDEGRDKRVPRFSVLLRPRRGTHWDGLSWR
jgi:hypothetical protein